MKIENRKPENMFSNFSKFENENNLQKIKTTNENTNQTNPKNL